MSISKTLKNLFDPKKVSRARPETVNQSMATSALRARRRTSAKPVVQVKSSRQAVYVPLAPDDPLANIKRVKFILKQEVRNIEPRIQVKKPKLPWDKVTSGDQHSKLHREFAYLPDQERDEFTKFIEVVKEDDDETLPDQLAASFRGCVSLKQAFGKFARPFVEELWMRSGTPCPWPPSVRLDVQLLCMDALETDKLIQHLKTDLALAKQVFSDPAVKTLEEGLQIFDLEHIKASELTSSPKSNPSKQLKPLAEPQAVPAAEVEQQIQSGDESSPLPGFVQTDRPTELSLKALGELASGGNPNAVLCAGPWRDKTVFGPRQEWVVSEAKKCAEYLLWHPVVGRHLIEYSKGDVVTVRGLQLALKQVEAED